MEVLSGRVMLSHDDRPAAIAWYTGVLGLRIYREFGVGGEVVGVVLFTGGGYLELSGSGVPASACRTGHLLWIQVADLHREYERLVADGVAGDEPPSVKPWGLVEARIRDPEGVGIVLVEVPADHPIRRRV